MRRYIFLIICALAFVLAGCSEEKPEPVVTYEVSTTEATTQGPSLSETEEPDSEQRAPEEPKMPYELVHAYAETSRDAVGNVWLNVVAAVKNTSDEPICLRQSTLLVSTASTELVSIEDAVCYPNVIEPGDCGYYCERCRVELDVNETLRVEVQPNVERAIGMSNQTVEDYRLYDLAYGIEVHGTYEPQVKEGIVCVAAILFDLNGDPVAILSDYIDASQTQFVLSSDKLPEGLHSSLVTAKIFVCPYEG